MVDFFGFCLALMVDFFWILFSVDGGFFLDFV